MSPTGSTSAVAGEGGVGEERVAEGAKGGAGGRRIAGSTVGGRDSCMPLLYHLLLCSRYICRLRSNAACAAALPSKPWIVTSAGLAFSCLMVSKKFCISRNVCLLRSARSFTSSQRRSLMGTPIILSSVSPSSVIFMSATGRIETRIPGWSGKVAKRSTSIASPSSAKVWGIKPYSTGYGAGPKFARSNLISPVSLSSSYLLCEPFGISTTTLNSSGAFSPSGMSCQRFIREKCSRLTLMAEGVIQLPFSLLPLPFLQRLSLRGTLTGRPDPAFPLLRCLRRSQAVWSSASHLAELPAVSLPDARQLFSPPQP